MYVLWQICTVCGDSGATAGCSYKRCSKTFHFYCAAKSTDVITEQLKQRNFVVYLYVMMVTDAC